MPLTSSNGCIDITRRVRRGKATWSTVYFEAEYKAFNNGTAKLYIEADGQGDNAAARSMVQNLKDMKDHIDKAIEEVESYFTKKS